MQKITLQIPMDSRLKIEAEKAALDQGFSSLQEVLRIFMKRFASKKIDISFEEENVIHLSPKADRRYAKIMRDIESGKEKVYMAKNVDDLMKQLNAK
ncbi:MAG: hypothetical protein Q7R77_03060 [Candidatus Daviesbacteria bacterium]|nr:hypothetical protein [Candidatus Daviesbacteria bacterium]